MLRAGIDIGTNTILLLIAEVENGVIRPIEDHVRVVRLGQGVDKNHVFHPDAMERARQCFREYVQVLKKYPGIEIRAVATSGSRDAKNSSAFFQEICAWGIPVRVISGEEEALYSFRGALGASSLEDVAVLDIGGGSTEVVGLRKNTTELFRYSFNMGCVRLTERYLHSDPVKGEERENLLHFVRKELENQKELLMELKSKRWVGVAGTATYLASSALGLTTFDPERVHGYKLQRRNVEELIDRFSILTAKERLGLGGMDKGRADVILAGALIFLEIMRMAGLEEVETSVRGLRYGVILD